MREQWLARALHSFYISDKQIRPPKTEKQKWAEKIAKEALAQKDCAKLFDAKVTGMDAQAFFDKIVSSVDKNITFDYEKLDDGVGGRTRGMGQNFLVQTPDGTVQYGGVKPKGKFVGQILADGSKVTKVFSNGVHVLANSSNNKISYNALCYHT